MNWMRKIPLIIGAVLVLALMISCAMQPGFPSQTLTGPSDADSSPQIPVWEHILDDQNIYVTNIAFDDLNNAWLTTTFGEVIYYNSAEREIVDTWEIGESLNSFSSLAIDPRGNVWIDVFPQRGVLFYEGELWTTVLPEHDVTEVTFDAQGRAWIGTNGDGLFVGYPDQWIHLQIDGFGCSNNEITALAVDSQGSVWAGTDDGAVVFVEDSISACYPLNSHIWEFIFDNKGGVYATTVLDGLYYLYQGEWEQLVSDTWIGPDHITVDADGLVWVTGRELRVFDGRDLVMRFPNIAGGIDISPSGIVWVYGSELHKYDGSEWTTYNADNSDISFSQGMGPLEFDHEGNVWIAGNIPGGIDIIYLE